jgi:hypothetical protein
MEILSMLQGMTIMHIYFTGENQLNQERISSGGKLEGKRNL